MLMSYLAQLPISFGALAIAFGIGYAIDRRPFTRLGWAYFVATACVMAFFAVQSDMHHWPWWLPIVFFALYYSCFALLTPNSWRLWGKAAKKGIEQ